MSSDQFVLYDVVVAGAGPVGLFLAGELALSGCSVLVMERATSPESPLKTLPFGLRGLTLSTMDALDRRGLLAAVRSRTVERGGGATVHWAGGARRPAGHFAGLQFFRDRVDETAWPSRPSGRSEMLAVAVADIEAVLADRAADLGVTIRRGCGVDALGQDADGVTVHAGVNRFRGKWLVGCDGGRSAVRKAAGIGFAGTEPEFTGYSMALRLADPHPLRPGRQHSIAGMYTYAPPGMATMVDFDGGARHGAGPPSRADVEAVLRRVSGTDVQVAALDLVTTWTDRAFLASDYRKGRVLLAGDAAHVHASLGGQGLNLGLGDAMNLGWKLAATVTGWAPPGLLDSYATERRPIAEQVLDWSRAQVVLLRPDPGAAALRSIVRDLMETRDGATYFAGRVWGANLRYGLGAVDHPLVGRSAPEMTLADGRRLDVHLRDGRALLLDPDPAEPLRELTADRHGRLGYVAGSVLSDPSCGALLIRPDGVVAWAACGEVDPSAAAGAITRWLGEPVGDRAQTFEDRAGPIGEQSSWQRP